MVGVYLRGAQPGNRPRLIPGMQRIVWWEIESPDPEAFQRFHAALWGWEHEPAFAGTELGADLEKTLRQVEALGGGHAPSPASS
jgi:hypothetical protein